MLPLIRRLLPYLIVAILIGAAYDGWVFYSRWQYAKQAEQEQRAKETEDARRTIDLLGGGQLKILNFGVSPGVIRRGEQANLCFGVYGAKSVRMEPPEEQLRPTTWHCTQVSPSKTTEYKLVAEDGVGHSETAKVTLRVSP